jgi:hypothetical protein
MPNANPNAKARIETPALFWNSHAAKPDSPAALFSVPSAYNSTSRLAPGTRVSVNWLGTRLKYHS